ncbi:MAG: hypothetical protein A3E01_09210 [Gammaproteobacteria bacterium RIFCSPHIGHO2_12_FULL_63_22]|nr:MAG: hypothetical protein A3E01_09210 [Gammaproteobacteria bacterium RIFCSPHIGHO2_12_FULL_63_22]
MATYRHSYVFRMAVSPVLYIWSGHGALETPADSVDASGATWLGGGHVVSVPSLKLLLNGAADRIDIRLSGITAEILRLVEEDRPEVQEAEVLIGRVEFDDDWQVSGTINWEWLGVADSMTIASGNSEKGRERVLTVSIRSGDTTRSNPQPAFFTDADQRGRSSDDAFFSHVGKINAGTSRRFGPA